ncbi:MAG: lysophospholipase [Polyangiaceae bacterium]|nr:lysophospholipase [Polyangiaceae bacterium]
MKRARWLAIAGGVAVAAVTFVQALRAVQAARTELRCFRPRRGPVDVPASVAEMRGRRDVTLVACGGVPLRGWYFPSLNRAAVILLHGTEADRRQLAPVARILVDAGFGVLAYDAPGHGESGGRVTFGRCEAEAVAEAAAFVAAQADVDGSRIGALGLSMGASVLAVAAPRIPRLQAVVLVSPFTDSDEQTRVETAPLGPAAQWAVAAVDRHFMKDGPLRPIASVGSLGGRALLVAAGADDVVVPSSMSRRVYDAATAKKEMVILPGGHADIDALVSGEAAERVVGFFERALVPPSTSVVGGLCPPPRPAKPVGAPPPGFGSRPKTSPSSSDAF